MDADVIFASVALAALLVVPPVAEHAIRRALARRRFSRDAPVLEIIFGFPWLQEWRSELAYRDRLAQELHVQLRPQHKTEEPLRTGTRVDLVVRLPRTEFYVSIKRGIENQERLTLQGEIEDIVNAVLPTGAEATVVVVIGFPPDQDPAKVDSQVQLLERHLADRRAELAKRAAAFEFYVLGVPILPSPLPLLGASFPLLENAPC